MNGKEISISLNTDVSCNALPACNVYPNDIATF